MLNTEKKSIQEEQAARAIAQKELHSLICCEYEAKEVHRFCERLIEGTLMHMMVEEDLAAPPQSLLFLLRFKELVMTIGLMQGDDPADYVLFDYKDVIKMKLAKIDKKNVATRS